MHTLLAALCFVNLMLFIYNFRALLSKMKENRSNKLSLLASSALIFQSGSLGLYFVYNIDGLVLASQIYILGVFLYLIHDKRSKKQGA